MGALPNLVPKSPRKPVSRALKPNTPDLLVAPRDLAAIEAAFRGAGSAWTPVPITFELDRFRLASGATFWALTGYLIHFFGRGRLPGVPFPWEGEIDITEIALLLRCSERQINRELLYMQQRDMAIVARLPGGKAVIRLVVLPEWAGDKQYPGWSNIPQAYTEWAAAQRQSLDEQADEAAAEEENPADKEKTVVKLSSQKVKRGGQSKRQTVDAFVKSMRVKCQENSVDIQFSGEVVSGELVLSVCGEKQQTPRSKNDAKSVESTNYKKYPGRGRPTEKKIPPNEGSKKYPQKGEVSVRDFLRGEELVHLFDPILLKSCHKSLSADHFALQACSEAIRDVPHDVLVKRVIERASRPINSPRACVAICREIEANWQRVKDLPAEKKLPTREEILEMAAQERAERRKR